MDVYSLVETSISLTKKGILHWSGRLEDYGDKSPILHTTTHKNAELKLVYSGWLFRRLGFYSLELELNGELITFNRRLLKNLHRVIKDQIRSREEQEGKQKEEEIENAHKNLIELNGESALS